jgi:Protein of unknown function (DUF2393)
VASPPDIELIRPAEPHERNWVPLAIAAGAVILVAAVLILILERGQTPTSVSPVNAALDPYAPSLPISNLAMSDSANLAGSKVTYVDGHIRNTGNRTVTGITVQVLFRDAAHEVTQNETQPLKLIRTRDPYIDIESVSAAPLKPGDERDFRLIFDAVSRDWDGAFPEIRVLHVESK